MTSELGVEGWKGESKSIQAETTLGGQMESDLLGGREDTTRVEKSFWGEGSNGGP